MFGMNFQLLLITIMIFLHCLWVTEPVCGTSDEAIYQDLLSGKRTLAAVGKVKNRVLVVIQPKNGNIPLNDTYVFEANITNDDYTELVLENGTLIQEKWPNMPTLTQPLLSAFFLLDLTKEYFLVICQKDPKTFVHCDANQVDGDGSISPSVLNLFNLKEDWSPPTLMSDTAIAFSSFRLASGGPDSAQLYAYTFSVDDNPDGSLDESAVWDKGHLPIYTLCYLNEARDQVMIVNTYAAECTQLGLVITGAFFDEHHSTFFAQDAIYRMERLANSTIGHYNKIQNFTYQQYFRLGRSESSRGLSVGATVAIVVIVIFLAIVALAFAIVFLCGFGSGLVSFGGGGSKSGRKSGKKTAANTPQKSNKIAKSKAASKK